MKTMMRGLFGLMMCGLGIGPVFGGQATTNATAWNGWGDDGTATASANYDGVGGEGIARTQTDTGDVNRSRALAVGYDRDGLDFSLSHAIAPRLGPAYAGTLNLSIGRDGQVSGSYGGVVSLGGLTRSVEAGGETRSDRDGGASVAHASGEASPNGQVEARTQSYNVQPTRYQIRRPVDGRQQVGPSNIRRGETRVVPVQVVRAGQPVRFARPVQVASGRVSERYRR